MESVSIAQVFADVTHDLVGPMNQVSSLPGLLVRKNPGLASDPDSSEILDHMQQVVTRTRTLADGLRTVARVLGEPTTRRPVDFAALLSAILANSEDKISVAKAQVCSGKLPTVMADSAQLMRVFQELIDNALKFHGSAPPQIEIHVEPRGKYWLFSVRDHGPGLDSKSAEQAFRIFRRLDPEKPGSGVGLTICRQVIGQHHGEMWIESELGRGTTVSFTLPITGEAHGAES